VHTYTQEENKMRREIYQVKIERERPRERKKKKCRKQREWPREIGE
jgi:hypothetical protein